MPPLRPHDRPARRRRATPLTLAREDLEVRIVPAEVGLGSIIPAGMVTPVDSVVPESGSQSPGGYSPQQIRTAYGFDGITFGSVDGDGTGQTIAIVDAYDDPGLVDSSASNFSTSDLAEFDRQFGLPDPPSFTKMNEAGNTSPMPGTDPAGPGNSNSNWEYEEAMDVEWAHALAPGASIVLVEATTGNVGDLYAAINTAKDLPGVSVVSLSWGGAEFSGENYWDPNFQTPTGHQGETFVASSGDTGVGIYPAYSPDVVAVGGTDLQLDAQGDILGETAWSGSGGGTSAYEAEPAYQEGVQDTGYRTIPDVAFDASSASGVSVYDSYDNTGGGPWVTMYGTSLGAPSWAALIAVADQGRVAAGGTTLDGGTQTLPALYSLPSTDFHDITGGSNNGYGAGPGYDEVTGLGSPVANRLAPDLAFYGMADHLAIVAEPGAAETAGQGFGLTVEVEQPDGALDAAASGTLTLSLGSHPGGASLGGTLTATIQDGVATFGGLTIDQAGSGYSLSVSGAGLGSTTSTAFSVTPAAASQLVIVAQPPSTLEAGESFGLTVAIEDVFGNPVADPPGDLTVALSGAGLGGTLSLAASNGVATFSGLSIDQAGAGATIQVSAAGLSTVDTSPIVVTPAVPSRLVIEAGPPSGVTAGAGFGLTADVEDAYGNLVTSFDGSLAVELSGGAAGAGLGGTTSVDAVGGVATFSGLELTEAGSGYVLTVQGTGIGAASTSAVQVTPAAASRLAIATEPPSSLTAGAAFGLSVAVEDAFGNLVADATGTVSLSMTNAGLLGTTDAPVIGGEASFSGLSIDSAGAGATIEASASGLASATTAAFSVTPASPSQLVMAAEPTGSLAAGSGIGLTVDVEDAFGNLVTSYGGGVSLGLVGGPADAGLVGTTAVSATGGVASFQGLSIDEAGTAYAIEATAPGLASATTDPFAVVPAAPSRLVIEAGPPSSVPAGAGFGLTVAVEDAYGNVETAYGGTVAIGLAGGTAEAGLDGATSEPVAGGLASFSGLDLTAAGPSYEIEATADGLAPASTGAFSVTPAAPSRLSVTRPPASPIAAGSPFGLGVAVEDAYGNVVTNSDATVALSLEGGGGDAVLGGVTTADASSGVATFDGLTLNQVGSSFTIAASSPGMVGAATAELSVTPAAPARLVITMQPSATVTAGSGFGLGVSVEDAFGNVMTGYTGVISVTAAGGAAGMTVGGPTSLRATQGTATFAGLTIDRAGRASLEVTADGVGSLSSTALQVGPGAPSQLVIVDEPPARLVAGQSFGFTAAVEDTYGNLTTGFDGTVTASLAGGPAGAKLSGPVSTQASDGMATFGGLALDTAGGYAVEATGDGLSAASSAAIAVSPAAPTRLEVTLQPPARVVPGRPFAVGVEAVDAYGNVATGFDGVVTASLDAKSGHTTLVGNSSATAVDGQAQIGDAIVKKAGPSYVVTITGGGLTPAITSVFEVTKPSSRGIAAAVRRLSHLSMMGRAGASPRGQGDRPEVRRDGPHHGRR